MSKVKTTRVRVRSNSTHGGIAWAWTIRTMLYTFLAGRGFSPVMVPEDGDIIVPVEAVPLLDAEHGVHQCTSRDHDHLGWRSTTFVEVTVGDRGQPDWQAQGPIRHYVMHPYRSARDLVSGGETARVLDVLLSGRLDLLRELPSLSAGQADD